MIIIKKLETDKHEDICPGCGSKFENDDYAYRKKDDSCYFICHECGLYGLVYDK